MSVTVEQKGKITQVVGVVVDAEFKQGELPAIYDALTIMHGGKKLYLEVAQHLNETTVRAISLSSTDGLRRGDDVTATGSPITISVGDETMGRMFNVVGEPIDGKPVVKSKVTASIHREAPSLDEQIGRASCRERV